MSDLEEKPGKLDLILEKLNRLEQIEQAREIEGSLSLNEGETPSQMFQVGRDHRDVSGEFDGLLTKTRYDNNLDVEKTNEPFIHRLYSTLYATRYGGCSVFVPVDEYEDDRGGFSELEGFEVFDQEPIDWKGRSCYEIFIDISSARARMNLKGRFASLGGKARVEKIHDNAAASNGQGYLDRHVPAPNMNVTDYKHKAGTGSVADVATDAVFEEV